MPRKVRLEYIGAIYHVMSRGDRRESIFSDDKDRERFVETLGETCARSGAVIYSYVLMGNHYHLLLGTPLGNLVTTMQWLQSTYTARFNARHRQCGHVFSGRYKAIPVQCDAPEYARVASDYIHLNPARAKILGEGERQLKEYRWSSFPGLCGFARLPAWVDGNTTLSWHHWNIGKQAGRRSYWRFLEGRALECEAEDAEDLKELRRGWFIGGEAFRERLQTEVDKVVDGKKRQSYSGEELRGRDEREAGRLLEKGLEVLRIEEVKGLAKNDERKQALAWLLKSHTVVGHEWVIESLNMGHRSNVTRAVSRFQKAEGSQIRKLKRKMIKCAD